MEFAGKFLKPVWRPMLQGELIEEWEIDLD